MDVDTTPGELEESPRDSVHSVPSFEVHDVNRWTRHSEALFEELRLPLDTMDRLERDPDAVLVAVESAQERLDSLRERRDEPISVESQLVETNAEVGGSNLAAMNDPGEERLQNNLRALRGRPSYFTPVTPMEEVRSGNYSEDEPSFSRTLQQAVTGMDLVTLDPEQTPSRVSGRSQEGMIPVTTPNPTQLAPSESFGLPEPSLLSRNLLSILQRPSFIDSPIPRWTAPPQWLQFQVLRTYEEGLMIDENQNSTNANAYATYTEDTRTQVETNLQGLLQARVDDDFISAPPQRWQQPEQWLQASLGYDVVARPPVRFDAAFDDGLITAPPRVNDPASTPTVTCSFGLMQQIGFGERKLEFYPETFNAMDAPFFANRVRSQASNTTDLMFLIITDWQPWFKNALQDALPDFPIQTLQHFTSPQVSSMLPSIDYNEGELTCIMEHINTHRKPQVKFANEREIDVGTAKAQCLPLVVWTRAQGAIEAQPERPLIVVIGKRTDKISSKIISHYANDRYKRWDRLTKNQAWVYLDLYFLFTKWDRIWAAVKRNQQKRTEEVHARQNVMPILQQTRQLHKDNNIMISLREHVRIHKASLKIVMQRVEYMLGGVDFMTTQGLKGRLDDAYQLLEYYEVTATTLLEQQQNLLSLAFNLETVAQGAAVARLNALAFVFLPLSFVASVFGITTFTAPPKWYPVAAVPVLLATVLVAYAANQFFTSRTMKESVVEVEEPLMPTSDLEKIPTRNSVAPVPIWQSVKMIWRRRTGSVTRSEKELPGTWAAKSTGINDPSRLLRRSTDRSLAARSYVPPRSTVQFIPGAFDYFSAGPSSYSAPSSQIPGSHSYDFAPGSSAMYDDPYSQVSQMSSSYSPIQSYQHYTEVAEAYGTPQHPSELGASLSARPSGTPVIPRLPIDDSEAVDADDLYTAGDELGVRTARAIFDFEATGSEDLSFKAGDILRLLPRTSRYKGWANARIGTKFGVVPLEFLEVIDPLQGGVSTTSTSGVANSHNKEISTSETGYFDPPAAFSQDGDDRGYRRDGPAFFGLPPNGFSSLFSGSTLEDPTSNSSSIPASRRFGTIFGGLDEVMMRETSANTRLEPIPEEGSIIADSV